MKAKNVVKYYGKEVIIKVPLSEVTNYNGQLLGQDEINNLANTPLTIALDTCAYDGDVYLENTYGKRIYVHHKFIKVKKDNLPTQTDTNP